MKPVSDDDAMLSAWQPQTSALLINEPPLQVLPQLAVKIGLNEAILVQQLHYLLRNTKFGKRIAEHQWIFNTYEEWVMTYFPFWSVRTMQRTFKSVAKLGLILSCQPEGRLSRRKYYRLDYAKLSEIAEGANLACSKVPTRHLPRAKTSCKDSLQKTIETASDEAACVPSVWKPDTRSKEEKLKTINPPDDFMDEEEFDEWLTENDFVHIIDKRSDLYYQLCLNKWHHWDQTSKKWKPIRDIHAYVGKLNEIIERAPKGGF